MLGKWRQSAAEVRELVERARDEAERGSILAYVITYARMSPRDWDAATYERIAAPLTAMGEDVLDRLVLARRRDGARRRAAGPGT